MKLPTLSRRAAVMLGGACVLLVLLVVVMAGGGNSSRPKLAQPATSTTGSSSSSAPRISTSRSPTSTNTGAPLPPAVRWWVSPAGGVGATLDAENPAANASGLKANQGDYCAMLRSSVTNSKSPLTLQSGQTANAAATARAWFAEIEALSAGNIRDAWKTLEPVFIDAVTSTSKPKNQQEPPVIAAATTVGDDARTTCHLVLAAGR